MKRGGDRSGVNKPRAIGDALAELLSKSGLDEDVARASVMDHWARVVGTQIASVTHPRLIADDGTLVVGVTTHGWMAELSMMERQLVAKLNDGASRAGVRRIRWELMR